MSKYLAFDIETATWPEDNDWKAVAPIGISWMAKSLYREDFYSWTND